MLKKSEIWLYRLSFLALAVFVVYGVFLLFFPTDARIAVFAALFSITLALGVLSGLMTVVVSKQ